ncbi:MULTISPECIES: chaplin [Streptomyces]|jgi:hypothetical protein|uniref:Chaplin n=1 Tax=Streptomyces doudnae TaxID=3075536 RepID=A0ABD5EQL7_9ACTN|nr:MULTISPECIES: chaplin [unclassified Streptomyces]MDT0436620.1 chaplin [Streptomyces sp. DSM 41981]MYQ65582.1 DUF320 domain-containing protein [Streptomyces sp. SID4950]SCE03091.1 Small secreted domain [Streptomyces sp. SolWspMP-5a-2]
MRRVTRNGVIAVAAVSGAMAVTGAAYADSGAHGAAVGSPGAVSGNTLQLPIDVPVNVCGDTVNVVGLLNPAMGNTCANGGGRSGAKPAGGRAGATTEGGSEADGSAVGSPGVVSGNGIKLPVHLPVNVSGNSVDVVGLLNPAFGNVSVNDPGEPHRPRPTPTHPTAPKPPGGPGENRNIPPAPQPAPQTPVHTEGRQVASLAHTGADATLPAAAASLALIVAGAAVYRRTRSRATR